MKDKKDNLYIVSIILGILGIVSFPLLGFLVNTQIDEDTLWNISRVLGVLGIIAGLFSRNKKRKIGIILSIIAIITPMAVSILAVVFVLFLWGASGA